MAVCGFASTSSLRTSTLPAYLVASFSISGATIRHGPHHSAQKSTTTGFSDWRTSVSKVASVTSGTLEDIRGSFLSNPASAGDLLQQSVGIEDAVVREPIEDGAPVATARDQPGGAQHRKVLAHVRDLAADLARQLADALLSAGESFDDAEPLGVGQGTRDGGGAHARCIPGEDRFHRA